MISKDECKAKIIEKIKNIYDPEIPVNIYDLGLIYELELFDADNGYQCYIEMTLTSASCPVGESLFDQVYNVSYLVDEVVEMKVDLVFDPPWDPNISMSYEAKLELGFL